MGKFSFVKRLDLAKLGAEAGSFLEFNPASWNESKAISALKPSDPNAPQGEQNMEMAEKILDMLKDKFVKGMIAGAEVAKEDLAELPGEVILEAQKLILGAPDANLSKPSTS